MIIVSQLKTNFMKIKVAYCTTPDGMGKDETTKLTLKELESVSKLPFNTVKAFSIHSQDNNLMQCVCDYIGIEPIQVFYIEFEELSATI